MKRRFPILLKVIILGIGVSILTSGAAITVSFFNQRSRSEQALIDNVDYTLDAVDETFSDIESTYTAVYIDQLKTVRNYVEEIYNADTDKRTPEDFETFKEFSDFYAAKYPWIYSPSDSKMGFVSKAEADVKLAYFTILNLLNNFQMSSAGQSVFLSYLDADNTMVFLMDSRMDGRSANPEAYYHVPGYSYQIQDTDRFEDKGKRNHYGYELAGYLTRFTPIYDTTSPENPHDLLMTLYIQYDLTGVRQESLEVFKKELLIIGLSALALVAIYTVFSYLLFVKNINRLSASSLEIKQHLVDKNMDKIVPINVTSNDEIRVLADSLTEMEKAIINYVGIIHAEAEARERTNAELAVASKIQLDSLPNEKLEDGNTSLRAYIKTAKEVGGDFYDYFYVDDHRLVVLISDVSGKGIPASLFMMKGKELIKSVLLSNTNNTLQVAANRVNSILARNNQELLFITSFIGVIDFNKNEIRYINAGHEKPYIVSKNELIKLDGESNIVLGVEGNYEFKEESHKFNKGDYLFMFTDGLNESINHQNEEFGYQRIEETLKDTSDLSLDGVIEKLRKNFKEFTRDKEQFDDITMLLIKNKELDLKLHFEKKDYTIIDEIVDTFNEKYSFLSAEVKSAVGIAIDELVNNLVSYEKREDLIIDVEFSIKNNKLHIKIISNGDDYDPFINHKDKYYTGKEENSSLGGFGVKLVKDLMDSYKYEYKDEHSMVLLTKNVK